MSGLIAMTSVLLVVGVEMFFASHGAGHSHAVDLDAIRGQHVPLQSRNKPLPPEPPFQDDDSDAELDHLDQIDPVSSAGLLHDPPAAAESPVSRQILQCLLLEAGILFHSVFIGMALSVSTGSAFVVLLFAISFHQTFEGLALGSRIAAIAFDPSSFKPWVMCLMYGITTPIGQAIGIALQGMYDPASELGLLMVGVVNAISTGLLLYAGLVQLLAEDLLSERSYHDLQGVLRVKACGAVVGGCFLMALVGAWA
ncbi:Zip-domain-containing protein [Piedraia hortae CBS 480.64]|uniref:Zip-domain-containing protein n=1 Tax=Piedraia hortae CBS 480.64 TaxID=1314780 RepID=A0A6A7BSP5_9PEZI|nr:Zip-domain-containing protein [Piedraia hortae CBS 480.64]